MRFTLYAGLLSLLFSSTALAQQNNQSAGGPPQGRPSQGRPMVQPDFFSAGVAAGAGWT